MFIIKSLWVLWMITVWHVRYRKCLLVGEERWRLPGFLLDGCRGFCFYFSAKWVSHGLYEKKGNPF